MSGFTPKSLLFLIPARGGSKGIPRKNLAPVGGIPLVARVVWAARRAAAELPYGCRVVCTTDDEEIAEVARDWGAEIPFIRPENLATDEASSMDVVLHAIQACGAEKGSVVVIQPTSPLVEPADIVECVQEHCAANGDPVVTVAELDHPVRWMFRLDDERHMVPVIAGAPPPRRQVAEGSVRLNGAVYVAASESLLDGGSFLSPATRAHIMPADRSVDIDHPVDLKIADGFLSARSQDAVSIGDRVIGSGEPCFIIAEIGVNHDGDVATALELVNAAAAARVDAVKIQTFSAEKLVTRTAPKAEYQLDTTDPGESQFEMLKRFELPFDDVRRIQQRSQKLGLVFLSTPFDESSADLLEELGVPAFKIGSGDLTNLPFLGHVANMGRPMIVSTGMATIREVADAVETIQRAGLDDLVLLHCVSNYPAAPETVNLEAMETMRRAFGSPVGFSDHTEGIAAALAAVAKGAVVVEKHFTLDRARPGPDHRASIEPDELVRLVEGIRAVEACLGSGDKNPAAAEMATAAVARKSIVALRDIGRGEMLDTRNTGVRRPEGGLAPKELPRVLGRRAACDIAEGAWLHPDMLD
jgi:N,N'-diacetyllegionaminate synthase